MGFSFSLWKDYINKDPRKEVKNTIVSAFTKKLRDRFYSLGSEYNI